MNESREQNSPLVYLIVLNWNHFQETIECVRSIKQLNYSDYRILVVDNKSENNSVKEIQRQIGSQIHLILNPSNLGFAAGNNVGIKFALKNDADYVVLLNNDTYINDADMISELVNTLERDTSIGLACPSIFYQDKPSQPWYAGAVFSLWRGGGRHIQRLPSTRTPLDTDYATGCCVIASRRLLVEVGLLDENFFLYQEDVDWSLRAKKAGFRVVYVPDAELIHKVSVSTRDDRGVGTYSPQIVYYKFRNRILITRKHGNLLQKYLIWPILILFQSLYHAAAYIVLGRWKKLKAMLLGLRAGLIDPLY